MKKLVLVIVVVITALVVCCVVSLFAIRSIPALQNMIPNNFITNSLFNLASPEEVAINSDDSSFEYSDGDTTLEYKTGDEVWPVEVGPTIPEFKYGVLESVSKISGVEGATWSIEYKNVEEGAFSNYEADLVDAGIEEPLAYENDTSWSLSGGINEVNVYAYYDKKEGVLNIVITQGYSEEK